MATKSYKEENNYLWMTLSKLLASMWTRFHAVIDPIRKLHPKRMNRGWSILNSLLNHIGTNKLRCLMWKHTLRQWDWSHPAWTLLKPCGSYSTPIFFLLPNLTKQKKRGENWNACFVYFFHYFWCLLPSVWNFYGTKLSYYWGWFLKRRGFAKITLVVC